MLGTFIVQLVMKLVASDASLYRTCKPNILFSLVFNSFGSLFFSSRNIVLFHSRCMI